ncbi:MAG: sterol desaturase family protein [Bacteroidia bacterium]|nr:sterol desaturase family protein [Bacteroidia bacterium]
MEAYAAVLLYAIPGFILLIIVEAIYGHFKGEDYFDGMDTIASLTSGTTNTLKSILGLTLVIVGYEWVHGKIALFNFEDTTLVYILSFICIDFASYWSHRLNHHVNYFWNTHVVHHSSEEFNLAVALRQTISNIFSIGGLFLIPAALLGLPPKVIAVIAPLHLFAQFWYHTRHIPKLGILEYIIVTPSQHRVHHAINPIYLDKNLGAIFCTWDRMFGTFQEELDDIPCVYGVKRQPMTWNPFKINFQHLWLLITDAWRAQSYWDKLRIWFMPTGWRPQDVSVNYPVEIVEDPYSMVKYAPKISDQIKAWSWFQFAVMQIFVAHMLIYIAKIPFDQLLIYGLLIGFHIYAFTALMDKDRYAFLAEIVKTLTGFGILFSYGSWFNAESFLPGASILVGGYLVLSLAVVSYMVLKKDFTRHYDSSMA